MRPEEIERADFPTTRRGLDPAAVEAHLQAVADHVETLEERLRDAGRSPSAPGMGGIARERVMGIIEAVEQSTEGIEAEARREAAAHVERVRSDVEGLRERIGTLDGVLAELSDRFREGLDRALAGLDAVEAEVGALRSAPAGDAADALAGLHDIAASAEPAEEPEPVEEPEEPGAVEEPASAPDGDGGADEEAARIVALNMALEGTAREEAVRRLSEEFELSDPEALVEEVYSRAG